MSCAKPQVQRLIMWGCETEPFQRERMMLAQLQTHIKPDAAEELVDRRAVIVHGYNVCLQNMPIWPGIKIMVNCYSGAPIGCQYPA